MCNKCDELKEKYQKTESIRDRQTFWNDYEKQRKACEKKEADGKGKK